MNEYRVFGPPGTGKTTYLSRQIAQAVEKYPPDKVLVASFTRAAAAELNSRRLPIPEENIGTLHAMAYRALYRPQIAEAKPDGFNSINPGLAVSGGSQSPEDIYAGGEENSGSAPGDKLLQEVNSLRARMVPEDLWRGDLKHFWAKWQAWKREEGRLDFTDLISEALRSVPVAPGRPAIGFFDEVQDFTRLELALVRKWGLDMETVLLAGDDDQCLYSFKGATPDAFLDPPVGPEFKRVLGRSYRVPRAVLEFADKLIRRVSRREPKDYQPNDDGGRIAQTTLNVHAGDEVADFVAGLEGTTMILGTCSYLLESVVRSLTEKRILFHNPFRRRNRRWNPLYSARGVRAWDRFCDFLSPSGAEGMFHGVHGRCWTIDELAVWLDGLNLSGFCKRGATKALKTLAGSTLGLEEYSDPWRWDRMDRGSKFVKEWMNPEAAAAAIALDVNWFAQNIAPAKAKSYTWPLDYYRKHGLARMADEPRVTVGTIHSVKGGEADNVLLFPDVAPAAFAGYLGGQGEKDALTRAFYVGATRARSSLYLGSPASVYCYQL